MKRIILIISAVLNFSILTAQDIEFFSINGELVIREGNHFTLQKSNDKVYLGALNQIPQNRGFPNLEQRDSLLNALLIQFLEGVVNKAKNTNKDTVFVDGFILKRGITAIGVKYFNADTYKVFIGKIFDETINPLYYDEPETEKDLVLRIKEYLELQTGVAFRFSDNIILSNEHGYNIKFYIRDIMDNYFSVIIRTNSSLRSLYEETETYSFNTFYNWMISFTLEEHEKYEHNSTHPRMIYRFCGEEFSLKIQLNPDTRNKHRILNGIKKLKITSETGTVFIQNIGQAIHRGNYKFIADYIYREVMHPFQNREIIYLEPKDPIFVQDSVLDIHKNGQFIRISNTPIDLIYADFVFPELMHRLDLNNATEIDGPLKKVDSTSISFKFLNEDYHVIATENIVEERIQYFYIRGYSNIPDQQEFVKLLSTIDFEERNEILVKIFGEDVLIVTSKRGGGFAIRKWNREKKEFRPIATIQHKLSDIQKDMCIEAVFKNYMEYKERVNIYLHNPEDYKKLNGLLFSFSNEKDLRLYLHRTSDDGTVKKTSLKNERFKIDQERKSFYKAILDSDRFFGDLRLIQNNEIPIIANANQQFGIFITDTIAPLITLDQGSYDSSIENKLISILSSQYPSYQEEAIILHWQNNNENNSEYIIIEYPKLQKYGVISGIPRITDFIQVEGLKPFASNSNLVHALLKNVLERSGKINAIIKIIGDPTDPAWYVEIDSLNFLAGHRLNQLYWLGNGFDTNVDSIADFLSHLSCFVNNSKIDKPEIQYMTQINGYWIYALQSNQFIMYAYNDSGFRVFKGEMENNEYWQDTVYLNSLLSEFDRVDTIITNIYNGVYISESNIIVSESKRIVSLWNDSLKEHHRPSTYFPEYTDNQREVLLNELASMFYNDNSFELSASNDISSKKAFGLYSSENKKWFYLENKRNPTFKIAKNIDEDLPPEIVDLFLENSRSAVEYHFESLDGSYFYLDSDNTLSRIITLNNAPSWTNLGELDSISNDYLPELFYATLNFISANIDIDTLVYFKHFNLPDNQVVLWGDQNTKQTIIREKNNGETKSIEQELYKKFIGSSGLLDQFFTECLNMNNPEKIMCFQVSQILGIYNPETKYWFLESDDTIAKTLIEPEVFDTINSDSDTIRKLRLVNVLMKKHSENPRLNYSENGFFFYYKDEIVVFYHNFFTRYKNLARYIKLSDLKRNISNNVDSDNRSKYGSDIGEQMIGILKDICIEGERLQYRIWMSTSTIKNYNSY